MEQTKEKAREQEIREEIAKLQTELKEVSVKWFAKAQKYTKPGRRPELFKGVKN